MGKKATIQSDVVFEDDQQDDQQEDQQDDQVIEDIDEEIVEDQDEEPKLHRDTVLESMYANRKAQIREQDVDPAMLEAEANEDEDDQGDPDPVESQPVMVDLKVDGEVIQRSQKEVDDAGGVANLQKKLSGEARLKKAAQERTELDLLKRRNNEFAEELKLREENLKIRETQIQTREVAPPPEPAKPVEISDEDAQAMADGIFSGDEEKVKLAFKSAVSKVITQQPAPQIVPQPVVVDVDAAVQEGLKKERYAHSIEEGRIAFAEKYGHLKADKNLYDMTNTATIRLKEEHPDWTPKQVILEAAKEVDDWVNSMKGVSNDDPPADDTLTRRRDTKRRTVRNVAAANTKSQAAPGYKPKTQQQIFDQYRRHRSG